MQGGLESKKEENDNDIAGNNSKHQPYKKRKKELAVESLFLDKKLKAIFNNRQQQQECIVDNSIKVETLASTTASEAVSPLGNSDNYQQQHQQNQPPLSTAVVLEDHRGHQLHPQFYQLYQAGHVMATSAVASSAEYSTGGGQARPSFRPFPDLSSTSNHTNY